MPTRGARLSALVRSTRLHYTQALGVELTYRFSLLQSFIGYAIGWCGLVLFWMAAGKSSSGAYSQAALLLYFIYASAHIMIQESRVSWNLSMGIRMGKLSASLLRPYPYLLSVLCQAASFATVRFVILSALFAGLLGLSESLRVAFLAVPASAWHVYVPALALAMAIGWLTRIGIGLLAFDMTQTWGPELIFLSFFVAASGSSYPPDLLPETVRNIVTWTPVYYMVGFPSLVLLGHVTGAQLNAEFVRGLVSLAVTAAVVFWLWRRGMRKFEAIGI